MMLFPFSDYLKRPRITQQTTTDHKSPNNTNNTYHYTGGRVLDDEREGIVHVIIHHEVKKIDDQAFALCPALQSIELPEGVEEIGCYAFSRCSSLTSINLPDRLEHIGYQAFSNCSSLTSIALPPNLSLLGGEVFSGCTSLVSITLPTTVQRIFRSPFSGCKSITSVNVPSSPCSYRSVNTRLLFIQAVRMMTPENMKIWTRRRDDHGGDDDRSPLMNAAGFSLRWQDMKEIFGANMPAIGETDVVTGLPVCLLAAVGSSSDLESVYRLCRENPPALQICKYKLYS